MQIPNDLLFSKRYLSLMALILVCCSTQLFAQSPPAPCSGIGASADDAKLQLSLKDVRSTFHQGEIITLQLAFTSRSKGKYRMDTRSSGQTGRTTREAFCLEPMAGSDPLADYFGAGAFSFTETPATGNTVLTKNPFRLDLD